MLTAPVFHAQDGSQVVSASRARPPNACNNAQHPQQHQQQQQGGTRWSPTEDSLEGVNGCKADEEERSGEEGPAFSLHSQEGDTEAANMVWPSVCVHNIHMHMLCFHYKAAASEDVHLQV